MRGPLRVVTPLGRSLVLLAVVCYVLDSAGRWPVFQLLWITFLLLFLAAVVARLLPRRARVELGVSPARTVAGDGAEVVLRATVTGAIPVPGPLVDVPAGPAEHLVRLPTLRRGRVVEERIGLAGLRRGVVPVGPVTARRTDPLGALRWTEVWSPSTELLVLPRMVAVESLGLGAVRDQEGTPTDEISMSDLAFHALREYVPGDELRHVHWRSSAKTDTLQIRQYHDTRRSHLTVVVDHDASSYADPDDFETAVSAAASIAARADRDGMDLSMLCGRHAVSGRGLDGILDACCRIELGTSNPVHAVREALRLAPETSWLVLLTGGELTHGDLAAVHTTLPPDVHLMVVSADASTPTSVGGTAHARLLDLRVLDELPRALAAASPKVLT